MNCASQANSAEDIAANQKRVNGIPCRLFPAEFPANSQQEIYLVARRARTAPPVMPASSAIFEATISILPAILFKA